MAHILTSANSIDPTVEWDQNTIDSIMEEARKHVWYLVQKYTTEVQLQLYGPKNVDLGPVKALQSRIMSELHVFQLLYTSIKRFTGQKE